MPHIIQGLFFQDRLELGVNYRPSFGTVAVADAMLAKYMFAGVIGESEGRLVGLTQDAFGVAQLSGIRLNDDGVAFRKIYSGRTDAIDYRFAIREGASWVGEYSGILTGRGIARCMIAEVPESFFEPAAIMAALGKTVPFEAPPLGRGKAS